MKVFEVDSCVVLGMIGVIFEIRETYNERKKKREVVVRQASKPSV